jgi:hypothetical protein
MGQRSVLLQPYYVCESVPSRSFDDSETGLLSYQDHPRSLREGSTLGKKNRMPMIVLVKATDDTAKGSMAQRGKRSLWFRWLLRRKLITSSFEDSSLSLSDPRIPSNTRLKQHLNLQHETSLEYMSIQEPPNQSIWKPNWNETVLNPNEGTKLTWEDSKATVSNTFPMNISSISSSLSSPDISISSVHAVATFQNFETSGVYNENNERSVSTLFETSGVYNENKERLVSTHPRKETKKSDSPIITSTIMNSLDNDSSMDIETLLVRSQSLLNKHLYLQYEPLQSPEMSPKVKDIEKTSHESSRFKVTNQKVAFETSLSEPISDWSTPTSLWFHDILSKPIENSHQDVHLAYRNTDQENDDVTKHILGADFTPSSHSNHGLKTHDWYNEIRGREKIAQYLAKQKKAGSHFDSHHLSSADVKERIWDDDSRIRERHESSSSYRGPLGAEPNHGLSQLQSKHANQKDGWIQFDRRELLTRTVSDRSGAQTNFVKPVVRRELAKDIPIVQVASEDGLLSIDSSREVSQSATPVISNRYEQHLKFMKSRVNGTKQF